MTNHPFESTGMVTDPGKVTRNLKLVSDYAKAQNIPLPAAIKDLEKTYGEGLETFKPVVPTAKKADTFVEKMKKTALSLPMPIGGMSPQIGGAEFFEQEYDPKLKRLVAKDRPTGAKRVIAGILDLPGLTDFDKRGGGFLGLGNQSLRGFGKQPEDFELPTTVKKALEDELDYAEGNTGSATEMKDAVDAMVDYKKRINPLERKDRLFDTGLEMAAQRAMLPFITNQMKDLSTFKQRQLLDAEKIKQSFPNAIQARMLTADTGFKTQQDAITGATDAATRFAQAGTGIKFG